jgi:hypothetical protein
MSTYDWRNPERVVPWKPRHRFGVTENGREAILRYREVVKEAQSSVDPRAELDRAKLGWAESLKLRPSDGIILDEFSQGRECLADMQDTLSACDLTLRDARGALDRLIAAGLILSAEAAQA